MMELTQPTDRLRAVFEYSSVGLGLLSPQGSWLFVNPALCQLLDYAAPRLLESNLTSLVEQKDVSKITTALEQLRTGAVNSVTLETDFRTSHGRAFHGSLILDRARPDSADSACFVAQLTNISRGQPGEPGSHDLRQVLKRVLAIGTITAYSLRMADSPVALSWVSDGISRLGYPDTEVIGTNWWPQRAHPQDTEIVEKAWRHLLERGHSQAEYRVRRKDGTYVWVRDDQLLVTNPSGRPVEVNGAWTEVTEQRQIEAQVQHAQRVESLGLLAAGIVHDLNNILTPILIATPLLREHVLDPKDTTMIDMLEKSALRGSTLLKQILTFARQSEGEAGPINLSHVLQDLLQMIGETFPRSITLKYMLPSDLYLVYGHATQLHQVLLNLCVNARDAMPDGGRLSVIVGNCARESLPPNSDGHRSRDTWIKIEVADTGIGMSPEVLARLWEPFFTTKPKGTGIGLSTVKGLVTSYGGFIDIKSAPAAGTTFTVYLPAEPEAAPNTPVVAESALPAPRGAGETVLIVDDESSLREVIGAMLRQHGYRVLAASDGIEAIALFQDRTNDIRLLVTDIHMPYMQGHVLIQVVKRIRPHVKCFALTGHPDATNLPMDSSAENADAMMFKPFPPREFLRKVSELIGRSPSDDASRTLPLWSGS